MAQNTTKRYNIHANDTEKNVSNHGQNTTKKILGSEDKKMVERTKAEGLTEFEAKVTDVKIETSTVNNEEMKQYHIEMKPTDETLVKKGETGLMHNWVRISANATETSVPEGSVLDKFLQEIEMVHPEAKQIANHKEVMELLKDNTYVFKRKKLGKSFGGHEAKEYWVPVQKK